MQGRSDFAVCGDKQACKLQFFERSQFLVKYITRFSEGLNASHLGLFAQACLSEYVEQVWKFD